jgi:hypothetical protein
VSATKTVASSFADSISRTKASPIVLLIDNQPIAPLTTKGNLLEDSPESYGRCKASTTLLGIKIHHSLQQTWQHYLKTQPSCKP